MGSIDLSKLQTESINANSTAIDTISTLELCSIINNEDANVAGAVGECLPTISAVIDQTAPRIRDGGRLVYVGAGTSGRLGILDASEIQPTFSAPAWQFVGIIAGGDKAIRTAQEGAEDSLTNAIHDLESLGLDATKDTLIAIAASGRTPYVLSCLEYAKRHGCMTIGIACSYPSEMQLCGFVDHMISVVSGPEVLTGSTRLKAGTATKMVLNMISTGVMIRIGKTYGNMMVDVRPSNFKLRQRARHIIRTIYPASIVLSNEHLDSTIKACNGSVKLALMHLMSGLDVQNSITLLQENGGVLKCALDAWRATLSPATSLESEQQHREPTTLVLCIDGGGSKCFIAVADQYGVTGQAQGGSCNFTDASINGLREVIMSTTALAISDYLSLCKKSSLAVDISIAAVRAGFSGFDRPGSPKSIKAMLADILPVVSEDCVEVMADTDLLASLFTNNTSCTRVTVLIAGTGSVAMSFRRNTETGQFMRAGRAGGWGHILGDEGSGFDIGRNAVRATLRAVQRRKLMGKRAERLEAFHEAIIKKVGLSSPEQQVTGVDLLSQVLQPPSEDSSSLKARLASVAPIVFEHHSTNHTAAGIISSAAGNLVALLEDLAGNADNSDGSLILAGGVLSSDVYRSVFQDRLSKNGLQFSSIEVVETPAKSVVETMRTALHA